MRKMLMSRWRRVAAGGACCVGLISGEKPATAGRRMLTGAGRAATPVERRGDSASRGDALAGGGTLRLRQCVQRPEPAACPVDEGSADEDSADEGFADEGFACSVLWS